MTYKPRLLRETAEIAFTEIKRFIEPRLREDFSLRRVSAPLYLPVGSPLLPPWAPGARVRLEAAKHDVEIVGALDLWLRDQLTRNDIAPGFGVFTIMNALRPDLPENLTSSPYVAAWAWQQATDRADARPAGMITMARKVHSLLIETDSMILSLFPHLQSTLSTHLEEVDFFLSQIAPTPTREVLLGKAGKEHPVELCHMIAETLEDAAHDAVTA